MRLSHVMFVAIVALAAGVNSVSAASAHQDAISTIAGAEQNAAIVGRFLKKKDTTADEEVELTDEEERAFPIAIPGLSGLKESLAKMKFKNWFTSNKTPAQVNTELSLATAKSGSFNWQLAVGYAAYFRNLKYGPYVIANSENKNNDNNK